MDLLGPAHIPLLVRYFDGVDAYVSSQFARPNLPEENQLSNEFSTAVHVEGEKSFARLEFGQGELRQAFADLQDGHNIDVSFQAVQHSKEFENQVSQSDIGLVIKYENVFDRHCFESGYLLQAKRLFPGKEGLFDAKSRFKSVDAKQHGRLQGVRNVLGGAVAYLLYCPSIYKFDTTTEMQIRSMHVKNTSRDIFDFTYGLALFNALSSGRGSFQQGIWVTDVSTKPSGLLSVHQHAFQQSFPLSWWVAALFSSSRRRDFSWPQVGSGSELAVKIATGDSNAVSDFLQSLAALELPSAEEHKPLPRYKLEVRLSVGFEVDEDKIIGPMD